MEYLIKNIKNIDNVHSYLIKKEEDIHRPLCNLFVELGFEEKQVVETIDICFESLGDDLLFLSSGKIDVYIFITDDYVNLVIKTNTAQEELNAIVGKYFSFPK